MQQPQRKTQRPLMFMTAVVSVATLAACGQRNEGNTPDGVKAPAPSTTTSTAPAPAPATPMPPATEVKPTADPVAVPGKGTDVAQEKGTRRPACRAAKPVQWGRQQPGPVRGRMAHF